MIPQSYKFPVPVLKCFSMWGDYELKMLKELLLSIFQNNFVAFIVFVISTYVNFAFDTYIHVHAWMHIHTQSNRNFIVPKSVKGMTRVVIQISKEL
jgi:hypothetical protein